MIFIEPQLRYFADLVIFDMLSITCGSAHREENSVLQTIIRNSAVNCGFMVGAVLIFFGIMNFKKILEQATSPQRHASATFFLVVFAFYFATFVVFAIVQCVDSIRLIFTSHKITPSETAAPETGAQPQPRP
ncbi:hypothetical protein OIU78_011728 [Salix suchowensis]|nr:hypothetical protein OIU78_011728 [Salix suchowensis]